MRIARVSFHVLASGRALVRANEQFVEVFEALESLGVAIRPVKITVSDRARSALRGDNPEGFSKFKEC